MKALGPCGRSWLHHRNPHFKLRNCFPIDGQCPDLRKHQKHMTTRERRCVQAEFWPMNRVRVTWELSSHKEVWATVGIIHLSTAIILNHKFIVISTHYYLHQLDSVLAAAYLFSIVGFLHPPISGNNLATVYWRPAVRKINTSILYLQ